MLRATLALASLLAAVAVQGQTVGLSRSQLSDGRHVQTHEVTLDASVDRVWAAISTAKGWESWAVPIAWDVGPDAIEASYSKAAKPGDSTTIRQQILYREPRRLMLFRTVKAPEGFPDIETYSKVTGLFELEPLGADRTRVRLTGSGFADTQSGRQLLEFFARGNKVSLERLRDSLKPDKAPPATAEGLRPLSFLSGHCWSGKISGGKQVDIHCFEPIYGGKHLRDRHEVTDQAGKVVYAGETIYGWNGKTKRVEFTYVSSDGGVSYGSMTPKDGTLDFGDQTFTGPDGRQLKIATTWRPVGDDAYDAISRSAFMPTGQRVVRYSRVRD